MYLQNWLAAVSEAWMDQSRHIAGGWTVSSEFDRLKQQKDAILARQSSKAWLIEFNMSVRGVPSYYGKTIEGLGITEEHLDALRFSRKEDAEAVIEDNGWTEASAVEHMWG